MKFPYNKVLQIRTQYQAGKLDRETAKEQLAYVLDLKDDSDFCKEAAGDTYKPVSYGPLLRLSDVCNTLRLFARIFCTEPILPKLSYRCRSGTIPIREWKMKNWMQALGQQI